MSFEGAQHRPLRVKGDSSSNLPAFTYEGARFRRFYDGRVDRPSSGSGVMVVDAFDHHTDSSARGCAPTIIFRAVAARMKVGAADHHGHYEGMMVDMFDHHTRQTV